MKLIVITPPQFFDGEAAALTALFRNGLEILHLRKPGASAQALERLLRQLPEEYLPRIVTHDHFPLATAFGLKGIHLNGRNPQPPAGYTGHVSRSCHSLEEVRRHKPACGYLFLSPIYDSISKEGYPAAYTREELRRARRAGLIDSRVMALGGVTLERLPETASLGFGGAVLLGDIWQRPPEEILPHFLELKRRASRPPVILAVAGSDASGGAGIQADIKTISALGGYAATALTAVTAQNTLGVQALYPLSAEAVQAQIASVMDDLRPDAVKIGMLPDAPAAAAVAECLRAYRPRHVVYDPVMLSTSGRRLMSEEALRTVRQELLPLCTLVTPNLNEASLLRGRPVTTVEAMEEAARCLSARYATRFLVKGGHLPGGDMCDVLGPTPPSPAADAPSCECLRYSAPRIESRNLHGTGCTLSSAIATLLAGGLPVSEAVREAKAYVSGAIERGKELRIGQGNGPLWHFPLPEGRT